MARRVAARPAGSATQIRCAIHTRKSTEEGLEQEFNSLDAQAEACAAYILSQRHEGWTQVKTRYDDGGYSGGNMERPGLRQLMADVGAGKVDVIVVYKVDRLTRSLADFARIVDVLDARGASFVSVTQAFNTTTSMGRLTLNVLLSFAQFEREVTGERIRDKIAASKKKGMWMGGPVPLGYRVHQRKLLVEEAEAATVRHIFTRYAALGSGSALIEELRAEGYRTKQRVSGERIVGGVPFTRGMLFALLANPIYIGRIQHKGEVHDGEHAAVIAADLWQEVQDRIASNRVARGPRRNARTTSLLAGILTDPLGRRMSPSHAKKGSRRYLYYVTHAAALMHGAPAAYRMPASDLEDAVVEALRGWLGSARTLRQVVASINAPVIASAIAAGERVADALQTSHGRRSIVAALFEQVKLTDEAIHIVLHRSALAAKLGTAIADAADLHLTISATKMRQGQATKLVLGTDTHLGSSVDAGLIQLLTDARAAQRLLASSPDMSIREIAAGQRQCRHRLARLVRLSYLAPGIVVDLCEGRQPRTLTPRKLLEADLPIDWAEQRRVLGFG